MNVLGAVAKGVGGVVFGTGEGRGGGHDGEVQMLLQSISESSLPQDRREAVAQLRDFLVGNTQAQLALGAQGFPILMRVIDQERRDVDLVSDSLESLAISLGYPPTVKHDGDGGEGAQAGAINSELFAREPTHVPLLLSLLEDEPVGCPDFYVRLHVLQLLTCLAMSSSHRLQEAILGAPMGMVRLMDMVGEADVLRNEALLLLGGLTRTSPDLQKIAAFEGAFDRLLSIIREEGGPDGGIVVQDCLELLNNLLRNNSANQLMFRETGGLASVPALLQLEEQDLGGGSGGLDRQKAINLLAALDTVMILVAPAPQDKQDASREASRAANAAALANAGLLEVLLRLAAAGGGVSSPPIRTQALRAVALVLAAAPSHQQRLMALALPDAGGERRPVLQAVLKTALRGDSAAERAAAEKVLKAFCKAGSEGQSALAATIIPAGNEPQEGPATFGAELVAALTGEDLQASARAAGVLSHILADNPACKERVLKIPLQLTAGPNAPPDLLMPRCLTYLRSALTGRSGQGEHFVEAVLLRTLIVWLHGCQPAVAALLASPMHMALILDIASGRLGGGDATIAGLAALLLGACMLAAPQAASAAVLDSTLQRLGLSDYLARLEDLRASPQFAAAAAGPRQARPTARRPRGEEATDRMDAVESPFDLEFTTLASAIEEAVREKISEVHGGSESESRRQRVSRAPAGATPEERLRDAELIIAQLDEEVASLESRNRAMAADALRAAAGGAAAPAFAAAVTGGGASDESHSEREALARASAAETQLEQLQGQYAALRSELAAVRKRADEASAAAARFEAELEDLSGAYNTLEQHSFQLEAQLRTQGNSGTSGLNEEDVERRVEEAAAAARAEGEEGLSDLLVCLGQEEAKVERLRQRLEELGEDPDALLEGLGGDDEEEEEEGEGPGADLS